MRNLLWKPLAGWALMALCCTGAVWAQDDDDVYGEGLLPPETRLMFSIPDVPALVEEIKGSALGAMLDDPEFKPFLDQVKQKLSEASDKVKEELGLTLEELGHLVQGEITFAIVEKPTRKLNAVVVVDFGENRASVDKLLELLNKSLTDAGSEHKTETISEVEVNVFQFPKSDQMPYNQVAYFTDESYFVIGSDVAALKSVIELWNSDDAESLAEQEVFKYILKQCSTEDQEPSIKWYLDFVGLLKGGVGMVQGQNPQAGLVLGVLPILGLDRLKGIGGGMDVGVGDFESISKTFIYAEQPPSGVPGIFQFPATKQAPPKWVAADTTMYLTANWDLAEAYLAIESMVDSFQGPGALGKILDSLAAQESGPQIHPKKDLLDLIGGSITVASASPELEEGAEAPPIPTFTATVSLKDAAAMKATLEKASKAEQFPGRVVELEGETLYEIPAGEGQSVFLGVVGEVLVIASSEANVSTVIAGEVDEPLSANEDFVALAKHFPAQTSFISFSQQDNQLETGYEMLRKQGADAVEGLDFSVLPDFESVLKYARPSGGYAVPDKKGALFVGFTLSDD